MAPKVRRGANCLTSHNASIDRNSNASLLAVTGGTQANNHHDSQAMLYIVCTLLFYSIGIVIGIVVYLKDEKQDIEENRMYDEFVAVKSRHSVLKDRRIKVQETIQRIEELERLKSLSCGRSIAGHCSRQDSIVTIMSTNPATTSPNRKYPAIPEQDHGSRTPGGADYAPFNCNVDAYDETQDPFPNRRLSQVVAEMLESDFESQEDYTSDRTPYNSDDCSSLTTEEVETDFIDYKEEPKNKELFRDVSREYRPTPLIGKPKTTLISTDAGASFDSLVRPFLSEKNDLIGPHALALSANNINSTTKDHFLSADLEKSCISRSHSDIERVRLQLPDGKPFKWSVTSV